MYLSERPVLNKREKCLSNRKLNFKNIASEQTKMVPYVGAKAQKSPHVEGQG